MSLRVAKKMLLSRGDSGAAAAAAAETTMPQKKIAKQKKLKKEKLKKIGGGSKTRFLSLDDFAKSQQVTMQQEKQKLNDRKSKLLKSSIWKKRYIYIFM